MTGIGIADTATGRLAPRIDYAALLDKAIAARANGQPLQDKLAEWQTRYRMSELKPIVDVLRAAHIIRCG